MIGYLMLLFVKIAAARDDCRPRPADQHPQQTSLSTTVSWKGKFPNNVCIVKGSLWEGGEGDVGGGGCRYVLACVVAASQGGS